MKHIAQAGSASLLRIITAVLLLSAAASISRADTDEADKAAIVDLYARWDKAVMASSIEGYKAILDEDVQLILPGAPNVVGRKAYGEFLSNVLPQARYKLTNLSGIEILIIGDYALADYHKRIDLSLHDPAKAVSEPGAVKESVSYNKYTDVLHRQPDGSWRVFRHVWTQSELQP